MAEKRTKDPITRKALPRKEPKPMSESAKKAIALKSKMKEHMRYIREQQRKK